SLNGANVGGRLDVIPFVDDLPAEDVRIRVVRRLQIKDVWPRRQQVDMVEQSAALNAVVAPHDDTLPLATEQDASVIAGIAGRHGDSIRLCQFVLKDRRLAASQRGVSGLLRRLRLVVSGVNDFYLSLHARELVVADGSELH